MQRKVKYCLLLKMFPKEQASGGNINIKYSFRLQGYSYIAKVTT